MTKEELNKAMGLLGNCGHSDYIEFADEKRKTKKEKLEQELAHVISKRTETEVKINKLQLKRQNQIVQEVYLEKKIREINESAWKCVCGGQLYFIKEHQVYPGAGSLRCEECFRDSGFCVNINEAKQEFYRKHNNTI